MADLGVTFRPQHPPELLRAVVAAAEESGLPELWLWEDCFKETAVTAAAAALAWSTRPRVGLGLLPVPLRNVALAAMELATLERMFPGRLVPAVGHGNQPWMAQAGARVDSPLTLLREHLAALHPLLRGEEVTTAGRYVTLDKVKLDWPPARPPALLAGAVGPRTVRLTGEAADGTLLTAGVSPDGVRAARRLIDEGRATAGRTGHHPVVAHLHAATGPDAEDRLQRELATWDDTGPDSFVAGDAAAIAAAVRRYADAGADTVVLQPTGDEPDLPAFVRFAATEVRPLLA